MEPKKKDGRSNLRAETKEFTEKEIRQLETAAGMGFTLQQLAKIFLISKKTLERRMADYPNIYDALERGRLKAKMNVRGMAYKMATDGKNPGMTMFWLKFFDGPDKNIDDPEDSLTETLIGSSLMAQELAAAVANMSPEEVARELKTIEMEVRHGVYSLPSPEPVK